MSYHLTIRPDRTLIDIAGPEKFVLRFSETDENPLTEQRIREALIEAKATSLIVASAGHLMSMWSWAVQLLGSIDSSVEPHIRMDGLMDPEFWGAVEMTLGGGGSETIVDVHADETGPTEFCVTSWDSSSQHDAEEVVAIGEGETLACKMVDSGHMQYLAITDGLDEIWSSCQRMAIATS